MFSPFCYKLSTLTERETFFFRILGSKLVKDS